MIRGMDPVHAIALVSIGPSVLVLFLGIGLSIWRSRRARGRGLPSRKRTATE